MNAKLERKERSHETILASAERLLRERGIAGARVADVMTGAGGMVEVQGTAEGEPFTRDQLDRLIDLAGQGIVTLIDAQRRALAT